MLDHQMPNYPNFPHAVGECDPGSTSTTLNEDFKHLSGAADPDLVTWAGPDDPTNPQNWSTSYKWFLTALCSIMTINMYFTFHNTAQPDCSLSLYRTLASSAPTATSNSIAIEFGVSYEVSVLVTTMFLCGYMLGPIIWGPGSELLGRRPIFIITLTAFTLLHLGQSLAPNIETLLVTRFLAGAFGVAPLSNCGGASRYNDDC
jgi:hypothetical protein